MSCENTDELRIITKYSSFPGETPTIPISADHNDGTWLPTDLYVGEMFVNVADNKAWVRGMDGIFQIGATGGSFSFTGDYVYKSTGGTYSGDVYAPTFSSIGVVTQNIEADIITATYFVGGSFVGDGSGLTGINANWLGGSVSNPSSFSSNLGLYGPVVIDGTITSGDNIVDICSDVNIGCGYGVSASYFIGDGSQLTNLPIGTYSNFYTISATLSGNEIQFNRNDLAPAYSVDLTPLLSTYSVSSLTFDGVTNELTLTYDNGNYFSALIDSFETLSVINDINANEVYANNFYGVFTGTFSNDIYTISATLSGTEGVFTRTDGVTYSLDLSSFSTGATPSLIDVLKSGNIAGSYSISSTDGNTKIYFPSAPLDPGLYIDSTDPGDFIAQLQVKKLNGVVTAHTDLNTGAGSSIDISSPNGVITSASDGAYLTQIQHTGLMINVSGDAPGFAGIQYAASYSTNYTNRSLVDKEYVDDAVAGAGGTLEETLALGNSTGTHSIIIGSASPGPTGTKIRTISGENSIYFAEAPFVSSTYIRNSVVDGYAYLQVSREDGIFSESVDDNTGNDAVFAVQSGNSTTPVITGTINDYGNNQTTSFNIESQNIRVSGENFAFAPTIFQGIVYENDYSENYTNRSLVDKEYVDNLIGGGLTDTVGFRTDTISVDADSGMFSGITSVVSTAGITGSVLVAEDRVLIESIDDYRSKIDMTSEQIVIVGGGDLDNSKYRSEVHQLGTKKVTYYDTTIASLGYGSAEKLQTFENSESWYFDASSTGTMVLFYDYFFVGAVMDYEYEFFIRSQSASGKLMTYKIKKNGYYDGGNNFFPILPLETQKGTDDPFANGDWDIVITPTGLGDQYVFNWNFTDGYIYTISVYKKYKQKKY